MLTKIKASYLNVYLLYFSLHAYQKDCNVVYPLTIQLTKNIHLENTINKYTCLLHKMPNKMNL